MLTGKIIITNHALQRFNERLRDNMFPADMKKYKSNPKKYLLNELRPLNIKEITSPKEDGTRRVYTKNNYRIVYKQENLDNIVLTITRVNQKQREKRY